MRQKWILVVSALLFPLVSSGEPPDVLIDVGHSHLNPGAHSARGVPEFAFNIALARVLYRELNDYSRVAFLGDEGDIHSIRVRGALVEAEPAKFLLSVHHDSVQERSLEEWIWEGRPQRRTAERFTGFSLFVSRRNPQVEKSLACASAIGAAMQQAGFGFTKHHADPIEGESREWADEANGVYYYDNLVVLRSATEPAVLLEAGIILNPDEEERLQTREVRGRIAKSVEQGLQVCGVVSTELRPKFVWPTGL